MTGPIADRPTDRPAAPPAHRGYAASALPGPTRIEPGADVRVTAIDGAIAVVAPL